MIVSRAWANKPTAAKSEHPLIMGFIVLGHWTSPAPTTSQACFVTWLRAYAVTAIHPGPRRTFSPRVPKAAVIDMSPPGTGPRVCIWLGREGGRSSDPSLCARLHFMSSQPFCPALLGLSCHVTAEEVAARSYEATSHGHRLAEAEAGLESRPAQAPSLHPFFLSFHLAFYFLFW